MRRSRFSEEQIIGILKQAEAGTKLGELLRQHGIPKETLYRWRRKYHGMEVAGARRLRRSKRRIGGSGGWWPTRR